MAISVLSGDVERTCLALLRYAHQVGATLRQVPDPGAPAVGIWNVAETATHLALSSAYFLEAARGQAMLEDLDNNATWTVKAVATEPERDLRRLAQRIEEGDSALVAYARESRGDPQVSPFQGLSVPLSVMLAVELGELIVHGFDIARAAGLPWPVDPTDAAVALAGEVRVLPLLLDRDRAADLHLRCQLHIRHGASAVLVVQDGALRVESPSGHPVDCHLSVDPLTFLLLSFHRIGQIRPMLTGKLLVWGRRPWLVPRLQSSLKSV